MIDEQPLHGSILAAAREAFCFDLSHYDERDMRDALNPIFKAYEAAKLAASPADVVERVARAICRANGPLSVDSKYTVQDENSKHTQKHLYWESFIKAAQAAIAAMPGPVGVSEKEFANIIRHVPLSISSTRRGDNGLRNPEDVLAAIRAAGYRIVKGAA